MGGGTGRRHHQRRVGDSFEGGCFHACMAPQSCVMNPARGAPPSASAEDTSPEDRAAGGTEEPDLSPVRRRGGKAPSLPFSVESLISDRTPDGTRFPPDGRRGCASPRGLCGSDRDAAEIGDRDAEPWSPTPYASPPSEYETFVSSSPSSVRSF